MSGRKDSRKNTQMKKGTTNQVSVDFRLSNYAFVC